MADWFDGIEIFDEIAFDDGPLETPTTWYDISDSVLSFTSFTGKTSLDTDLAPGYASLRLDNAEGHFTPQNTYGDYYPNVKPMRRFRRRVLVDATEYVVFTGYVLSWDQDWRARTSYVDVPLVDGSRLVENTPLPASAYESEVLDDSPSHYWPLQAATATAEDLAGNLNLTRQGSVLTDDGALPRGGESFVISPSGFGSGYRRGTAGTPPRSVEVWLYGSASWAFVTARMGRYDDFEMVINDRTITSLRMSHDGAARSFTLSEPISLPARNGGLYVAIVMDDPSTIYVYVNGQRLWSDTLTVGSIDFGIDQPDVTIDAAEGIAHVALYPSALTAAQIRDHNEVAVIAYAPPGYSEFGGARIERALDDVGFPAGMRDLDAGQTIHGAYLPAGQGLLDYLRQIERAEQGLVFFGGDGSVTFRDRASLSAGAGDVIFSDDIDDIEAGAIEYTAGNPRGNPIDWIRNIVTSSYNQTGAITRRDSTSVTDYGEARDTVDSPTLPDARAASNLAAYVVRERKDPKSLFPALTVEMRPNTNDKMHELFGLTLGSVVTVRRTPFDLADEIEATAIVLGMEHNNPGESGQWYVTLYLAPAPVQYDDADTPLLRVGSGADTNKIGAAAGNIIIA